MPDYRAYFDKEYLGAWDLPPGKDVTLTIEKVEARVLNNGKKENKKPILFFKGKKKGMAANVTNCRTIAALYGKNTEDWIGRQIAIFATTTSMGGETVECIRVRPFDPATRRQRAPEPEPEPPEDRGDEPTEEEMSRPSGGMS